MMPQPLRMHRDYGSNEEVNPYLNTSPTELKRNIEKEKDNSKKKLMKNALEAWRVVVPNPFWRSAVAGELVKIAKILTKEV